MPHKSAQLKNHQNGALQKRKILYKNKFFQAKVQLEQKCERRVKQGNKKRANAHANTTSCAVISQFHSYLAYFWAHLFFAARLFAYFVWFHRHIHTYMLATFYTSYFSTFIKRKTRARYRNKYNSNSCNTIK